LHIAEKFAYGERINVTFPAEHGLSGKRAAAWLELIGETEKTPVKQIIISLH